ncbi:obscurin-like [Branchiostoma lanceolatum]|uniref:obscurin-like n=1 Tax=Branchiostoma lanceolatum TaxID=7740 RepID=UPI003455D741
MPYVDFEPGLEDQYAVEADPKAKFTCTMTKAHADATWYREDAELEASDKYEMLVDGQVHHLIIHDILLTDQTAYSCASKHNKTTANLFVEALIDFPSALKDQYAVEGDAKSVFTCQMTAANSEATWYREDDVLEASDKYEISVDGYVYMLVIKDVKREDQTYYSCASKHRKTTANLYVEVPAKFVLGMEDQYAIEGDEQVVFNCAMSVPDRQVTWYREDEALSADFKYDLVSEGTMHRLIIRDVRRQDQTRYACASKDDRTEANLTVEVLHKFTQGMDDQRAVEGDVEAAFTCLLSEEDAKVQWYCEGQQLETCDKFEMVVDGKLQELIIKDIVLEDETEYTCTSKDDSTTAMLYVEALPPEIKRGLEDVEIYEKETASFEIELTKPVEEFSWSKKGETLEASEKVAIEQLNNLTYRLILRDAVLEDEGSIKFESGDLKSTAMLTVKALPSEIEKNLEDVEIYEKETATFELELTKPVEEYRWYKKGTALEMSQNVLMVEEGSLYRLTLQDCQVDDQGAVKFESGHVRPSASLIVKALIKSAHGLEDQTIFETETANFEIELARPFDEFTWYKNGEALTPSDTVVMERDECTYRLTLHKCHLSDTGEVKFGFLDLESAAKLTVKALLKKGLQDREVFETETAVFETELCRPVDQFRWFRKGEELVAGENVVFETDEARYKLTLKNCQMKDAGEIKFEFMGLDTAANLTVKDMVKKGLEDVEIFETENASFQIILAKPIDSYSWHQKGTKLEENDNIIMQVDEFIYRLTLKNCSMEDAGSIKFEFFGIESNGSLIVKDLLKKGLDDVEIFEKETANFQVVLAKAVKEFRWFKHGEILEPGDDCLMRAEGVLYSLTLKHCVIEDTSAIKFEFLNHETSGQLIVKALPPQLRRDLKDQEIWEEEAARFELELTKPVDVFSWFLKGEELTQGENVIFEDEENVHRLILLNCSVDQTGAVRFSTGGLISSATLVVKALPIEIIRGLTDQEVFEMESASFEIELSRPVEDFKWYKKGIKLEEDNNVTFEVVEERTYKVELRDCHLDDMGTVRFEAGSVKPSATLIVKALPIEIIKGLQDQEVFEQESASFEIELGRALPGAKWFKKGLELESSDTVKIEQTDRTYKLDLLDCQLSDMGTIKFECGPVRPTATLIVKAQPIEVIRGLQDQEVFESESATFFIELSRVIEEFRWYKKGLLLDPGEDVIVHRDDRTYNLELRNCQISDMGTVRFEAGPVKPAATLIVKALPIDVVRNLHDVEIYEAETANFEIELSRPLPVFKWFKKGQELQATDDISIEQDGRTYKLELRNCVLGDMGTITFEAGPLKPTAMLIVKALPVDIIKGLEDVEVFEMETASFQIELNRQIKTYRWFKKGELLELGDSVEYSLEENTYSLNLRNCKISDMGTVRFEAGPVKPTATLIVKALPIVVRRELQDVTLYEHETAEFEIELGRPIEEYKWFLKNKLLEASDRVVLETEGAKYKVTIKGCLLKDMGTVRFEAGPLKPTATLIVRALPVEIVRELDDQEVFETETAGFDIELNRSVAEFRWYKKGEILEANDDVKMEQEGPTYKLFLRNCLLKDIGNVKFETGNLKSSAILMVKALPAEIRRNLQDVEIFEGETATFEIEMARPIEGFKWFRKGLELQPEDDIIFEQEGLLVYRVTLKNCLQGHTGNVKFVTGQLQSTASLIVKAIPVDVIRDLEDQEVWEKETASFEVELSQPVSDFHWIQKKQDLHPSARVEFQTDENTQRLIIHDCRTEDIGPVKFNTETLQLSAILMVKELPLKIVKGLEDQEIWEKQMATYEVELNKPDMNVFWFRENVRIVPNDEIEVRSKGNVYTLVLHKRKLTDAGEIRFSVGELASTAQLIVKELPVEFGSELQDQEVWEDETARFEIELSRQITEFHWYKKGEELQTGASVDFLQDGNVYKLVLMDCKIEDMGTIKFETEDRKSSATLVVKELPVEITRQLEDVEVYERDSATFEVELNKKEMQVQWFKKGVLLEDSGRRTPGRVTPHESVDIMCDDYKYKCTLHNCQLEDMGEIKFLVNSHKAKAHLRVKELPIGFLLGLKDQRAVERDDMAKFTCTMSKKGQVAKWFFESEPCEENGKYQFEVDGTAYSLIIRDIKLTDAGKYTCASKDSETTANLVVDPLPLKIEKDLEDVEVWEKETAVFQTELNHPDRPIVWFKKGQQLEPSDTVQMTSEGMKYFLTIRDAQLTDMGTIKFQVEGLKSAATLLVKELPYTFTLELEDQRAMERDPLSTFTCEMSKPDIEATWYRGEEKIKAGEKYEMEREGCVHRLLIRGIRLDDASSYTCANKDNKTTAALVVDALPLEIVRDLEDVEVWEKETATFAIEMNHEGREVEWYKKGGKCEKSDTVDMKSEGYKYYLVIQDCQLSDMGTVKFQSDRQKSSATLLVKGTPCNMSAGSALSTHRLF